MFATGISNDGDGVSALIQTRRRLLGFRAARSIPSINNFVDVQRASIDSGDPNDLVIPRDDDVLDHRPEVGPSSVEFELRGGSSSPEREVSRFGGPRSRTGGTHAIVARSISP